MTGKQLSDFREKYNLSRSQVAKLLGVHITTVTNWESAPTKAISKRYVGQLALLQGKLKELKATAGAAYSDEALGAILAGAAGLLAGGLIGGLVGHLFSEASKKAGDKK
jgi:transcriptional regulator with XRE-family HTH domain